MAHIVRFLSAAAIRSVLLLLSGLSCTATVIFLAVASPAFVLFSPILVPAGLVISLVVSGFILSGGLAVATLPVLSWIWKHPFRSQQLEAKYAPTKVKDTAGAGLANYENGDEEEEDEDTEKKAEEDTEAS